MRLVPVPESELRGRAADYGEATRTVEEFAASGNAAAEVVLDLPARHGRTDAARIVAGALAQAVRRSGLPVKSVQRGERVFLRRVAPASGQRG